MTATELLYQRNEWIITLLLLAVLLAAAEVGFQRGRLAAASYSDSRRSQFAILQGGLGGLLALLLAFTFSMAGGRFEARKQQAVDEANAVGTATLRARLLPQPYDGAALELFRQYTDNRISAYRVEVDSAELSEADVQLAMERSELWRVAHEAAAKNSNVVPTGLFIQALNEAFDSQARRDAMRDNHVPESILLLLVAVATLTMLMAGYGCGLATYRNIASIVTMAAAIAMVTLTIVDLDRPRRGLIRVSDQAMMAVRQSLDEPVPPGSPP